MFFRTEFASTGITGMYVYATALVLIASLAAPLARHIDGAYNDRHHDRVSSLGHNRRTSTTTPMTKSYSSTAYDDNDDGSMITVIVRRPFVAVVALSHVPLASQHVLRPTTLARSAGITGEMSG